ncbi:MAG: hypothetical protein AB1706_18080, partial [Pseudomonadota bacterium]
EDIEKISITQMTELILRQINTDKAESVVAANFLGSMIARIPGVTAITTLLQTISEMVDSVSLAKYTFSKNSAQDTTSSPRTLPES